MMVQSVLLVCFVKTLMATRMLLNDHWISKTSSNTFLLYNAKYCVFLAFIILSNSDIEFSRSCLTSKAVNTMSIRTNGSNKQTRENKIPETKRRTGVGILQMQHFFSITTFGTLFVLYISRKHPFRFACCR